MKLENKFYNAFFYLFLLYVFLSIIIVAFILTYYSNKYLDKKSAEDIFNIEKKYATININSVNVLISNLLVKIQLGLLEQLKLYENIASKITDYSKSTIEEDVHNALDIKIKGEEPIDYSSIWFVDKYTINVRNKSSSLYQQISIFSQLTKTLYSVYFSMNDILMDIYFLFEETNLMIAYPYIYFKNSGFMNEFKNYKNNPTWCTDEKGDIIDYYKFKCREFYNDIIKSKKDTYDVNIHEQPDRKIFVTPSYNQLGLINGEVIFSICIEFYDTISKNNAYLCGDINSKKLFNSFDSFNEKLIGYFSITSIGFHKTFYFPQMSSNGYGKTLGEYIFRWDRNYYLEEKLDFMNIIEKNMTSNYYTYINKENINSDLINVFNEIYIDNSDGENQNFYFNGEKYNYCIFPIILEDYKTNFEHILSIIYLFKKKLYYQQMLNYQNEGTSKLILQLALFIFFGVVILYLIVLSFKILAKYIVIPIKNVQYMLEGINIGGEFRLEYLNNLKKKQEDNLEKLNKINQQIMQNNSEKNKKKNFNDEQKKEIKNENKEIVVKSTMKNIQSDKDKENEENKFSIIEQKTIRNVNTNTGIKTIRDDVKLLNMSTEEDTDINLEYNGELINPKFNYDKQYDLENDVL